VWPYGIEVLAPLFDQHLGLTECVEHLAIQQLVAQLAVPKLEQLPPSQTGDSQG
jgi:hypothetical protein